MTFRFYFWLIIFTHHRNEILIDGQCETVIDGVNKIGVMNCSGRSITELPIPDRDEFYDVNFVTLDLRNCRSLRILDDRKLLKHYPNLKEFYASYVPDMHFQRSNSYTTTHTFYDMNQLEVLHFTYTELIDGEWWETPNKLRILNLDGNRYTELNVTTSPKLEILSANDNRLVKMPLFSDPAPPVTEMYLKNSPLTSFTVNDIIPLCNLKRLECEFPSGSKLITANGWCQCVQLKKWVEMVKIQGTEFNCVTPAKEVQCDLNLTDSAKLRRNCPDFGALFPTMQKFNFMWILILVALLLLLLLLSALLAYKFLIKHEKQLFPPEEPSIEEEILEETGEETLGAENENQ